jgi:SAM-dependent methyltransferase
MERKVYDRMRELQRDHWWFAARREILADQIRRLPLSCPAQMVEVGCGPGGNLEMLSGFGRVCAVEPDAESRAYAAEQTGLDVRTGFLPDGLPDFGQMFDLAVALDVIEHVDDDHGALAAMAGLVRPGGFLLATVPANTWMWSAHDEAHHHKRRYGRANFCRAMENSGLEIRRATYFNSLLFPLIAAVRLTKKAIGRNDGDEDALPSPVINSALKGLFRCERSLLKAFDLPFGVSIMVIAQRPG